MASMRLSMRSQGGRPMLMVSVDDATDLVYLAGQNVVAIALLAAE